MEQADDEERDHGSAEEPVAMANTQDIEEEESQEEEPNEAPARVVVTGVEKQESEARTWFTLHAYQVQCVVTSASDSYCAQRSVPVFIGMLNAVTKAALQVDASASCPEFPAKAVENDAVLAQWCSDVTQFLNGMAAVYQGIKNKEADTILLSVCQHLRQSARME